MVDGPEPAPPCSYRAAGTGRANQRRADAIVEATVCRFGADERAAPILLRATRRVRGSYAAARYRRAGPCGAPRPHSKSLA